MKYQRSICSGTDSLKSFDIKAGLSLICAVSGSDSNCKSIYAGSGNKVDSLLGGMFFATAIATFIIPSLYVICEIVAEKIGIRKKAKKKTSDDYL